MVAGISRHGQTNSAGLVIEFARATIASPHYHQEVSS